MNGASQLSQGSKPTVSRGWAIGVPSVLLTTALMLQGSLLAAAEPFDGKTLQLSGPVAEVALTVDLDGLTISAQQPVELRGTVAFLNSEASGLTATVISDNLRGVTEPDWRRTRTVAGTRLDPQVHFTSRAFGTPDERARWGIGGNDWDWNRFSIQWDGWLQLDEESTDLATASDDGSRLWLDRNRNGVVDPGEWGGNSWGMFQGTTQRLVHARIPRGSYRIRLQFEEGAGENACSLLWSQKDGEFTPIPPRGFKTQPTLTLQGPITLAARITGAGEVRAGSGVRLVAAPAEAALAITGTVTLAPSLTRLAGPVRLFPNSELDLGSGSLSCPLVSGSGTIRLAGGRLELPAGATALRLAGTGAIAVAGVADCADFAPALQIVRGALRSAARCHARLALAAPLTTVLRVAATAEEPQLLEVRVDIPQDAPRDLGLGCWRTDPQGRWFQQLTRGPLPPGRHDLAFALTATDALTAEGHGGRWTGDAAADARALGIFLYSAYSSQATVGIEATWKRSSGSRTSGVHRFVELDAPASAQTGQRWQLSVRPDPYPTAPCDPDVFRLDLAVTAPDGTTTTYAGFHDEPVSAIDRGDREEFITSGPPRFLVRFRPRQAGRHTLRLTAKWTGGGDAAIDLPPLEATGAPWDDIVRVDKRDSRFFSAGNSFVWPAGCNLNSNYDVRSRSNLQTILTPDRGSFTRMALLERLAAGGANGCEVWLSPWSLGLEWIPLWPGFRGTGRFHQGHAWALDRFLDRAEALGMRVIISIFNHGMARRSSGAEDDWKFHPYNVAQGGWLTEPAGLFEDERAFTKQSALFRYLAARYGDSPAVLSWKLWAEVNLAHAPRDSIRDWHSRASVAFREVDPWQHPVTSHWYGDWETVDRETAAIPTIDFLTIDAYKEDDTLIADLLCRSTRDPLARGQGLAWTKKPVLTTEFGGSAMATSRARLRAEHAIGPWAGLVAGHAGSPMLWWFEWIDQEDRFAVYGAINRYLAGEDLRDPRAQTIAPVASADGGPLWCRAWSRPGRLLGYVLDRQWGLGEPPTPISGATILIGDEVKPGAMTVEWWDADHGTVLEHRGFSHPGGRLELHPATFAKHLAFKLTRP